MRTRIAIIAAAALAATGVLLSCTADGGSIYATIETEQKVPVSTLNQTITVQDLVNMTGQPLPYFVAAGAVYNGTLDSTTNIMGWPKPNVTPVPISPPKAGAICQSLSLSPVGGDTSLYAGFMASDGTGMGLFQSASSGSTFDTTKGGTQIAPSGSVNFTGKQITLLQVIADPVNLPGGPYLFVVAASLASGASNYTYELDYSSAPDVAGSWTQVNFKVTKPVAQTTTELAAPITGVGFLGRSPGPTFYVTTAATTSTNPATPSNLYEGDLAALGAGLTQNGTAAMVTDDLTGVTVDDANSNILIPAKSGTVYFSPDNGVTWTAFQTADQVNGANVHFLTVSQPVGTTGPIYLVGSDGLGFYYLNISPYATSTFAKGLTRFSDVTVTGLYAGAVRRIMKDGTLVFMGTAGTGLWRSTFDVTTGSLSGSWIHE
jgi:hypothetical protein